MTSPTQGKKVTKHVRFASDESIDLSPYSPFSERRLSFSSSSSSPPTSLSSFSPPSPLSMRMANLPSISFSPPADISVPSTPLMGNISLPSTPVPADIPLPPSPDTAPLLHSILASLTPEKLHWDMSQPITEARYQQTPLSPSRLLEAATHPTITRMAISMPLLPWSVAMTSGSTNSQTITLYDVLEGMYLFLRTPVSGEDMGYLSSDAQERVQETFRRRYRKNPTTREEEKQAGIRRIDLLMGYTYWSGLVTMSAGATWQLRVSQA